MIITTLGDHPARQGFGESEVCVSGTISNRLRYLGG